MTTTATRTRSRLRFAGHYLEMVVAMFVGMYALGPLWTFALPGLPGLPGLPDRPDITAMVMATDMSIGMAGWMLVRRHPWPHIGEMCAAMVVPFAALLVPYWTGLIDGGTLMLAGHLLMFPAMLLPMLRHRHHY